MRPEVLILCGVLASSALAGEDPATRRAREELERQLQELTLPTAPKLLLLYAPPDGLAYRVAEAQFTLDGKALPSPTPEELNAGGPREVFSGEVKPGKHELLSQLVFVPASAQVFTYMEGFRWKIGAKASFEMPSGLAMRVRVLPSVVPQAAVGRELNLTHDFAVKLVSPLGETDAGPEAPPPVNPPVDEPIAPEIIAPPKNATLTVTATSRKKRVAAQVRLLGEDGPPASTGTEPLALMVAAGRHVVQLEGKGLLASARMVEVAPSAVKAVAFELSPVPRKAAVLDAGKSLTLLKPLRFSPGKAVLLPASSAILAEVVDLLLRLEIKKLRIEVFTDNEGEAAALQKLSQEQAEAIVAALGEAGIDPARLEALGRGDTQPVAPNLTAAGRERNRRVELTVLERGEP